MLDETVAADRRQDSAKVHDVPYHTGPLGSRETTAGRRNAGYGGAVFRALSNPGASGTIAAVNFRRDALVY
jgi:hypothetical protein